MKKARSFLLVAMLTLLVACGGGGGGSTTPTPSPVIDTTAPALTLATASPASVTTTIVITANEDLGGAGLAITVKNGATALNGSTALGAGNRSIIWTSFAQLPYNAALSVTGTARDLAGNVGTITSTVTTVDATTIALQSTCEATNVWARPYDLVIGNFTVSNSWWGVDAGFVTPRTSFHQCISAQPLGGVNDLTASWNWKFDSDAVITGLSGYPGIAYGLNPGNGSGPGNVRTNTGLPLLVSEIKDLSVTYDVDVTATGYVQTFFDLYFAATREPTLATMTHEVSISIRAPQWVGSHQYVGLATLGGNPFDVWVEPVIPNVPNAAGIVFVPQSSMMKGTIKVKDVTSFLASHGLMRNDVYLADIEFGTEPSGGEGTVVVKHYSISAN